MGGARERLTAMAVDEMSPESSPAPREGDRPRGLMRRPERAETVAYGVLGVALFALLWWRTSAVDGFYLDEWFYVHGAEYIWEQLPGGLVETIPEWNRGPQRLYSSLLAPLWTPFGAQTAFTLAHLLNVALLVGTIVPAALLARRVIDAPWLRVLAVALAVAVPWLTISAHLLTENLAFPLFLWVAYLSIRAAERPTVANQLLALLAVGAIALCRLNLAPMFLALAAAVVAAEALRWLDRGDAGGRDFLVAAVRRNAVVVAASLLALLAAAALLLRGSGNLGAYGGFTFEYLTDSAWGERAENVRRTFATYLRSLVVGSGILPVVLGLAVALAGLAGRLGRRFVVFAAVALTGLLVVLAGVSTWTAGAALEERYVFYAYSPLAILAVAGVGHLGRLRNWIAAGGAVSLWALVTGIAFPAVNAGHFFAAPAGAFWSRVVEHRLRRWEDDLLGWTLLEPTAWLLPALAVAGLVAFLTLARARPSLRMGVVATALGVCVLLQLAILNYSYKQELYGTTDAAGGIALSDDRAADREIWVDAAVPGDEPVAAVLGVLHPGAPYGGIDRLSFWNRAIDVAVGIPWTGSPVVAPPGFAVVQSDPGPDGLAAWSGEPVRYLAQYEDDPRLQYAGEVVARSPVSPYVLKELEQPGSPAVWTAVGLDGDGALLEGRAATLTLDRERTGARTVSLAIQAPAGASEPVLWRISGRDGIVARGRLAPGAETTARLRVPPCESSCDPATWRLSGSGGTEGLAFPSYGAPGPPRPVHLLVPAARVQG